MLPDVHIDRNRGLHRSAPNRMHSRRTTTSHDDHISRRYLGMQFPWPTLMPRPGTTAASKDDLATDAGDGAATYPHSAVTIRRDIDCPSPAYSRSLRDSITRRARFRTGNPLANGGIHAAAHRALKTNLTIHCWYQSQESSRDPDCLDVSKKSSGLSQNLESGV